MTIKQLSVFLENREGRLDEVLKTLGTNDVNIVALSLADTADYGMLRMIVSDPKKGKAVLKEAGITSMLTDVVALRVPHATGSLSKAMHEIVQAGINVEYMYAFANGADASAVLKSDNPEKVVSVLKTAGFDVLLDDRKERAGVKFSDADLIGLPIRVTVGRGITDGLVEVKVRQTGEVAEVAVSDLMTFIQEKYETLA